MNDNCIVVSCGELDDGMNIPDDEEVCACPEGLVKCIQGCAYGGVASCTKVCCDEGCLPDSGNRAQERCYSYDNDPESKFCANVEDGGCPCLEGEKKCVGEFDAYGSLPKSNCIKHYGLL